MTLMTLTALYDARAEADRAAERLVRDIGVARGDVAVMAQETTAAGSGTPTVGAGESTGFFGSLKNLFMPEEDRHAYSEAVSHGAFLLTARVEQGVAERAMDVLEEHGAVDLDDRRQSWRAEGPSSQPATGAAATLADGAVATAAAAAAPQPVPATAPAAAPAAAPRSSGSDDEKIELVEETLRVGKRTVGGGRVRVRSYVVETPVEQQVSLREEHVAIERRPMDRAPTAADEALFGERVIEATETGEEAIVAKDARVTEEVVVRKGLEERVETVHDTVRRTEVEVDDTRVSDAEGTAAVPSASPPGRVAPAPRR